MKHILTSGCSFTKNQRFYIDKIVNDDETLHSWPEYLQKYLGNDIKVYNLGGATNDNVSITRILFHYIKKLISEGVSSKDIIVIGQWTDPNRESIYFINNNIEENTRDLPHTLSYDKNWINEKGMFFLTGGYAPPIGDDTAVDFFDIEEYIMCHEVDVNRNNVINPTLHWLESWSHFELYCEKYGIKTYWMSMRNIFSKESYDIFFGAPNNNDEIPTRNNWMKDYGVLKPYLDQVPIDGDNYWHWKNYNGLLEWTLANKDTDSEMINPFQESVGKTWQEYLNHQANGWGHPSPEMMEKFVKEELINFIDNAING